MAEAAADEHAERHVLLTRGAQGVVLASACRARTMQGVETHVMPAPTVSSDRPQAMPPQYSTYCRRSMHSSTSARPRASRLRAPLLRP